MILHISILLAMTMASGTKEDPFSRLPTYNLATPEQIKKDFVRMKFEPLGDPNLRMTFLVARQWQAVPLVVSRAQLENDSKAPVEIVRVRSAEKDASISIAYVRVGTSVDVEKWARLYIEGNGLKLLLFQKGKFSGRDVFDALVETPDGQMARTTFSRHGERMIIIFGACKKNLYDRYALNFALATVSFRLEGNSAANKAR